jgi:hypothetical protein
LNFGGWFPLDDVSSVAPDTPGLLQARADTLVSYPRGRSAMVLYAHSRADETLRIYVAGRGAPVVGHASSAGARWIRFGSAAAPEMEFDRLMRQFVDRFGARPKANVDDAGHDDDGKARSPNA